MSDENSVDRRRGGKLSWLVLGVVVGVPYLVLSMPEGATKLTADHGWTWLGTAARWGFDLQAALPAFGELQLWLVWAVGAFMIGLVVLSVRHRRVDLAAVGIPTLLVSLGVVPALAWGLILARGAAEFLRHVLLAVRTIAGHVVAAVLRFLTGLAEFLFDPTSHPWAWVFLPLAGVLMVWLIVRIARRLSGADFGEFREGCLFFLPALSITAVMIVLMVLLGWVVQQIAVFLLGAEVTVHTVLLCATAGQLVIDQLRSSLLAGNERLGVAMGAMGLGSALSVLMFAADSYHVYRLYPEPVARWAQQYVWSSSGPQLDTCITLVAVALSLVSILKNLPALREAPEWGEFHKSLVYLVLGLAMALVVPTLNDRLARRGAGEATDSA